MGAVFFLTVQASQKANRGWRKWGNVWETKARDSDLTGPPPPISACFDRDWKKRVHDRPLDSRRTKDGFTGRGKAGVQLEDLADVPGREGTSARDTSHCRGKVLSRAKERQPVTKLRAHIIRVKARFHPKRNRLLT